MQIFITFVIFTSCFALMAVGYIFARKVLKKGCSIDPDSCACRSEGKDPSECDK